MVDKTLIELIPSCFDRQHEKAVIMRIAMPNLSCCWIYLFVIIQPCTPVCQEWKQGKKKATENNCDNITEEVIPTRHSPRVKR